MPGPATGLAPDDAILDLDFAIAEDLHLAWSAAIAGAPGTAPSYKTFYAHGDRKGRHWSPPFEVDDTMGAPRLLTDGRNVTLITGLRLVASVSRDAGRSWGPPRELLPTGARKVAAFDAALQGEDLVVACILQPSTPYDRSARTRDHDQRVVVLRVAPEGAVSETEIGRFSPSLLAPARPRLVATGKRLLLAVALNMDEGAPAITEQPLLLWFETDLESRSWSSALTIDLATGAEALGRITDVDLIEVDGAEHVLLAGHAVHVVSSQGDGWSPPRRLNPYAISRSRGEQRAPAIAAVANGSAGRIAWIDHRNRHSDRRPWNPLGGLPWSDDSPEWADNDVFTVPARTLAALTARTAPLPQRLTTEASLARAVEVAAMDDKFLVAWAGRLDVGKELTSGQAPRIFLMSFPVPGTGSATTP